MVLPENRASGQAGHIADHNTLHDLFNALEALPDGQIIVGDSGSGAANTDLGINYAAQPADGADGAAGTNGADGADGADGRTVLNGTVNPGGGDGVDGDFWINTATDEIFGPKTAGVWGSGTSLVGATGATGLGVDGALSTITHSIAGALTLDFSSSLAGFYVTASANITDIVISNGATAGNVKRRSLFVEATATITLAFASIDVSDADTPAAMNSGDTFAADVLDNGSGTV